MSGYGPKTFLISTLPMRLDLPFPASTVQAIRIDNQSVTYCTLQGWTDGPDEPIAPNTEILLIADDPPRGPFNLLAPAALPQLALASPPASALVVTVYQNGDPLPKGNWPLYHATIQNIGGPVTTSATTELTAVNDPNRGMAVVYDGVSLLQLSPVLPAGLNHQLGWQLNWVDSSGNTRLGPKIDPNALGALTIPGNIAGVGGIVAVGRGVELLVVEVLDTAVTVTTAVTIVSITPTASGQFHISADFTLNNSGTITLKVTFTNRNGVASTLFLTSGATVLNAAALVAGTYSAHGETVTATTASAVAVVFQDTTAAPTDHVTASVKAIQ